MTLAVVVGLAAFFAGAILGAVLTILFMTQAYEG